MIVTLYGVRGSLACSGSEIEMYGGNTSCVSVSESDDTVLILDAGTGIRYLGVVLDKKIRRVDILLSHFHLDHLQGLGFFKPLYDPFMEVHIYGPASSNHDLYKQLARYFSMPLFPVAIRDFPCKLYLHAVPRVEFSIGMFNIFGQMICHPGFTLGYRITSPNGKIAYLPDHEPALGSKHFPLEAEWTSGYEIAAGVELLIHDAQYTEEEYPSHIGWGHSTIDQAVLFAQLTKVKKLVTFHHDPEHTDNILDNMTSKAIAALPPHTLELRCGREGDVFIVKQN